MSEGGFHSESPPLVLEVVTSLFCINKVLCGVREGKGAGYFVPHHIKALIPSCGLVTQINSRKPPPKYHFLACERLQHMNLEVQQKHLSHGMFRRKY